MVDPHGECEIVSADRLGCRVPEQLGVSERPNHNKVFFISLEGVRFTAQAYFS